MSPEVLRYAAFTRDGAGGNPAGVVLDADRLSDSAMLAIAQTVGYSETAFLSRRTDGSLGMRFFSPVAEVAFCGHATVASAIAIAERTAPGALRFETPAGLVPVLTERRGSELTATLTSPPAHSRPAHDDELREALGAFGWTASELHVEFPSHVAFAGNHHLIVGVRDRQVLSDLDYDFDRLADVMAKRGWTTVHVFHQRGHNAYDVRNAFPPGGVREDPATGAAAAAFGGYLRAIGAFDPFAETVLLQGDDLGAPSTLVISAVPDSDAVQVRGTARRIPTSPTDPELGGIR
jgi:PhzF family phenazine biosynthesis protein